MMICGGASGVIAWRARSQSGNATACERSIRAQTFELVKQRVFVFLHPLERVDVVLIAEAITRHPLAATLIEADTASFDLDQQDTLGRVREYEVSFAVARCASCGGCQPGDAVEDDPSRGELRFQCIVELHLGSATWVIADGVGKLFWPDYP